MFAELLMKDVPIFYHHMMTQNENVQMKAKSIT